MDFLKLAEERYSVRKYSSRPVEKEKIEAILKAATLAPTGCNNQPQRILVVDDPSVLEKIRKCTTCQFGAPVTFVICYDKDACWVNPEGNGIGVTDASIVTAYMQLAAADQGLGTCWVAYFDAAKLVEELKIPSNFKPVAVLPLGYAADDAKPAHLHFERRQSKEFTWENHF